MTNNPTNWKKRDHYGKLQEGITAENNDVDCCWLVDYYGLSLV